MLFVRIDKCSEIDDYRQIERRRRNIRKRIEKTEEKREVRHRDACASATATPSDGASTLAASDGRIARSRHPVSLHIASRFSSSPFSSVTSSHSRSFYSHFPHPSRSRSARAQLRTYTRAHISHYPFRYPCS